MAPSLKAGLRSVSVMTTSPSAAALVAAGPTHIPVGSETFDVGVARSGLFRILVRVVPFPAPVAAVAAVAAASLHHWLLSRTRITKRRSTIRTGWRSARAGRARQARPRASRALPAPPRMWADQARPAL